MRRLQYGRKNTVRARDQNKGRLVQPEVKRSDTDALDIKFHACPLKEAWQAAEFPAEKIRTLCRIAGVVDNGTFEAAGFAFSAEIWQPGDEGCCFLHIRRGRLAD